MRVTYKKCTNFSHQWRNSTWLGIKLPLKKTYTTTRKDIIVHFFFKRPIKRDLSIQEQRSSDSLRTYLLTLHTLIFPKLFKATHGQPNRNTGWRNTLMEHCSCNNLGMYYLCVQIMARNLGILATLAFFANCSFLEF